MNINNPSFKTLFFKYIFLYNCPLHPPTCLYHTSVLLLSIDQVNRCIQHQEERGRHIHNHTSPADEEEMHAGCRKEERILTARMQTV